MASVDVGLSSDASGQWQHNKEITRLCNLIWNVIIYSGKGRYFIYDYYYVPKHNYYILLYIIIIITL